MPEPRFEDQLRRILHAEADAIPFRITSADVRRRVVTSQRRSTVSRALVGLAAAFVIAGGALFIIGSRPATIPIAGSPTPSATRSDGQPKPSPSSSASRRPLGDADTAIFYRFDADPAGSGQPLLVLLAGTPDGRTSTIATIRTSTLPADANINVEDPLGRRVSVGDAGYAVVRYVVGEDAAIARHAVYDLENVDAPPLVVDADGRAVWGPGARLAIVGDKTLRVDASNLSSATLSPPPGVIVLEAWAADGSGLVARRELGGDPPKYEIGVVSVDGRFTRTDGPPAVYQATGLERPVGASGEFAAPSCDQYGASPPPGITGCFVVGILPDGTRTRWLTGKQDQPFPSVVQWNATGSALWAVTEVQDATRKGRLIELRALTGQDRARVAARTERAPGAQAQLVGLSSMDRDAIVFVQEDDQGTMVRMDTRTGAATPLEPAVGVDGFAGWARAQDPYLGR